MPLRGRWVAGQLSCILILRDESPEPQPSNKASSTKLTRQSTEGQDSRLLQLVRVRESSPALFTPGSAQLSQLPQVARIEGHPPPPPTHLMTEEWQGQLSLPYFLGASSPTPQLSTPLSSQGAEPAFLKAAAGERLEQFSRTLQAVRSRTSCAHLLDTHVVPSSCSKQRYHRVL